MAIFIAANVSFLNPCSDGNVHTNAASKDLKQKAFKVKRENIKQAIGIQVTFIVEIKL